MRSRGRGRRFLFRRGYTVLWTGWQGDLPDVPGGRPLELVRVPVARNADGSPITGPVLARWSNVPAGTTTLSLAQAGVSAVTLGASLPASLDTHAARLETHEAESTAGERRAASPRSRGRRLGVWATLAPPFPGAPTPPRLPAEDGADPRLLYQLVYTAKDPLVLMLGFAAIRDAGSFFRYEARDAAGTPNPLAGAVRHVIATGQSQSGNTQKTFVHYGFNEDEAGRPVWDGANPHIAALEPLHGLPIAYKDLESAIGFPWSRGSLIYKDEMPSEDSGLIARLRAAGALAIGKTNTPEFGMGSHTYSVGPGTTRNPYDLTKSAGGSSGGAAVALATGMLPFADGSDFGGSLRNPASFNVVGFRPSVGLVTTAPTDAPFLGYSVKGPMARTVSDAFSAQCSGRTTTHDQERIRLTHPSLQSPSPRP